MSSVRKRAARVKEWESRAKKRNIRTEKHGSPVLKREFRVEKQRTPTKKHKPHAKKRESRILKQGARVEKLADHFCFLKPTTPSSTSVSFSMVIGKVSEFNKYPLYVSSKSAQLTNPSVPPKTTGFT